jgi:hypothetical protein
VSEAREDQLAAILHLEDGPERTAGLAAWFQGLYGDDGMPILVGGGALELYTGGAYTSGDLDFVGHLPDAVAHKLELAGFTKLGRHWVHEAAQVFIELPGSSLEPHERADEVRFGRWTVLVLSPEDTLVDRLAGWQFWNSTADAYGALLLWRRSPTRFDRKRLVAAAAARGVTPSLARLERISHKLGAEPTLEDLGRWLNEDA